MANLFLFPEQSGEDAARHALGEKLKDLARRNIWIGTSSWKYEGWLGDIYARERYMARGHFSKKRFEETCLAEYAETFPVVCGDFSFYQFPIPSYWQKLFGLTPDNFRFAFKVPEEITVKRWPVHARYGARGGAVNESFLNAGLLDELFLKPLAPYGDRAALLVLEFGTYSKSDFASVAEFAEALDAFLAALRRGPRYAVEVRNREFLVPEYFRILKRHGIAHVFNAWSRMPELREQMALPGAFTADFTVVRALLRAGRSYEQAVARFAPYRTVRDPNPEARAAMRALIDQSVAEGRTAYVFVNNRLEGNAPSTIRAIADLDRP